MQSVAATLIVVVLIGMALYFGWQQRAALYWLRFQTDLPPEDRHYYRRQAWLRLTNSVLMLVLATLVAGYYLSGLETRVTALEERVQQQRDRAEAITFDLEQNQLRYRFAAFCFTILVLLMAIVFLVAIDLWAIRRYSHRHLRQLQAERRAMMETQMARLRSERNGHG